MRCWIGFYVAVISVIVVALEGSYLVKFVTRFAEEIFAILISIVFIYEVVKQLVHVSEVGFMHMSSVICLLCVVNGMCMTSLMCLVHLLSVTGIFFIISLIIVIILAFILTIFIIID